MRTFQTTCAIGFIYSGIVLARITTPNVGAAFWLHVLYTLWFAIAFVCVEAIIHRIKAGVYGLFLATLVITLAEFGRGIATIGGASLGLLVAYITYIFVSPVWGEMK